MNCTTRGLISRQVIVRRKDRKTVEGLERYISRDPELGMLNRENIRMSDETPRTVHS